ncbi:M56 family metallopeptidase [Bizionia sp.]|uniref:M56 family metallopeptidase n=1 Tax=Bizionia sp. TaxID=1954480 RepID=UPI003A8ED479
MDIYILKFSACLAVFMLFYKLVLERESIHHFKRFYLLAALLGSVAIPFITFTTFVDASAFGNPIVFSNLETISTPTEIAPSISYYLPTILWSIYYLGVLIFAGRFTNNFIKLINRIKQNPKHKKGNLVHVLLSDLIYPHTFLQYIFLNKSKYEAHKIPQEVLLHEETHAKQKHALDILFIELMQIIFWFNPLLYFIKKDIKLNHEFLADQAVLKTGTDTKTYQHILLAFSASKTMEDAQTHHLANAINYSLIKKRFTVMKSHTSNTVKWVKGLIILPVLAVLIYSFSSTKEVFRPSKPGIIKTTEAIESKKDQTKLLLKIYDVICEDCRFSFDKALVKNLKIETNTTETISSFKFKVPGKPTVNVVGNALSEEALTNLNSAKIGDYITIYDIKASINSIKTPILIELVDNLIPPPPPPVPANATPEQKTKYKNVSNEYYKKYKVDNGKVSERLQPPPPPPPVPANATPEQKAKYETLSNEYYSKYKVTNGKVEHKLPPPPPPSIPANATPEQKKEYIKAQHDYNRNHKVKKVQKSKMPPPPPPAPKTMAVGKKIDQDYYDSLSTLNPDKNAKTGFITINNKTHFYTTNEDETKYYNRLGYEVDINGKTLSTTQTNGADVIAGQKISKVYQNNQVVSEFNTDWVSETNDRQEIPQPPAPPSVAQSAHELVKSLKENDIKYYYNDKLVSYSEILEITKKEPNINISTKITDGKGTAHFSTVK